ncbi:hypothetical protein ABZ341_29250 [Streptomyces sp. NPDC006173]|uniref:hypothetical protein n=1 Tax=Streptomyces sp. NPDC006173 TaxID=3155349 RepID=UPI00341086EF
MAGAGPGQGAGRRDRPDRGADTHPHWGDNGHPPFLDHYHDAARGHRDFVSHIDQSLEEYLRGCTFRLEERREPRPGQLLPALR